LQCFKDLQMSEWQPIETAPTDIPILVTDGAFVAALILKKDSKFPDGVAFGGYEWDWDFDPRDLTHWMPLPKPPEDGK
jgi:hypothetical protein